MSEKKFFKKNVDNIDMKETEMEKVEEYLKENLQREEIPESLLPENMKKKLEEASMESMKKRDVKKMEKARIRGRWTTFIATAACFGLLITAGIYGMNAGKEETTNSSQSTISKQEFHEKTTEGGNTEEGNKNTEIRDKENQEQEKLEKNQQMYQKIYDSMEKSWPVRKTSQKESGFLEKLFGIRTDDLAGGATAEAPAADDMIESGAIEESAAEESLVTGGAVLEESIVESATGSSLNSDNNVAQKNDYGETNVQVEFVDEGDIVKNDGRYLYQIVNKEAHSFYQQEIQIVDTENGLERIAVIDGFENIKEFYVQEDKMIIIESLWLDFVEDFYEDGAREEPISEIATEEVIATEEIVVASKYGGNAFQKVYVYDISQKNSPKEIHTFTIKGDYKTSRISQGYLYFFVGYETVRPDSEDDFETYIPTVEGELLDADSLYLPEDSDATNYLMMLSVDLSNPVAFTDKMAAVTWGNYYYVSGENIYVLDSCQSQKQDGIRCDGTRILKFSYEKGQITPVCEGVVDGTILDQFAMDEYQGHFRMITTVNPYKVETIIDDVSGEEIGVYSSQSMNQSNNIYVLDDKLQVVGSIENLAEEERVYSARFFGDIGYFVTFRQTDPLFSVDFSNPKDPKIIGELKISGFSEYLHFYGENRLLGIGQEADEETGVTEGIKLSMFDISNPADVKEINKLVTEYDHSEALYNHHSVLISMNKNLIGFTAESFGQDYIREYTTYEYQENGFSHRFSIDCTPGEENDFNYYEGRGTYIGDTFYFLLGDGSVIAYDLNTEEKMEELEP